jgi:protein-L-isoaspartate(D-aspartate) O-methyltransferase
MILPEEEREGFAAFMLRMRSRGIVRKDVMAAFESTPRAGFVPSQWREHAWAGGMLPIECGEAIESPDLQAQALAALDIGPNHRILEIGTGSGYTAAVMSRIAQRVLTVDRYRTLVETAGQRFETLGIANIVARQADGAGGLPAEGPFDRIIVWAAFEAPPRSFADQISSNGIMIAPIGPAEAPQTMVKLTKTGSRFEREELATVRLQPLVPGMAARI